MEFSDTVSYQHNLTLIFLLVLIIILLINSTNCADSDYSENNFWHFLFFTQSWIKPEELKGVKSVFFKYHKVIFQNTSKTFKSQKHSNNSSKSSVLWCSLIRTGCTSEDLLRCLRQISREAVSVNNTPVIWRLAMASWVRGDNNKHSNWPINRSVAVTSVRHAITWHCVIIVWSKITVSNSLLIVIPPWS